MTSKAALELADEWLGSLIDGDEAVRKLAADFDSFAATREGEGEPQVLQPYAGTVWKHKKRGSSYTFVGTADVQVTDCILEGHRVVVYRANDGKLWVRPTEEFFDGRFECVPPVASGEREGDAERARERMADLLKRRADVYSPKREAKPYYGDDDIDLLLSALRSSREEREAAVAEADTWRKRYTKTLRQLEDALTIGTETAVAEARRAAVALLRNPTSDMLNRAADDIRRNIDPLQQRARYLLDAVADDVERALITATSYELRVCLS